MNTPVAQIKEPFEAPLPVKKAAHSVGFASALASRLRALNPIAVPVATIISLGIHLLGAKNEPAADPHSYSVFLGIILSASLIAAALRPCWRGLRRWLAHMCPIIGAAFLVLCLWEMITSGFRLLPLPYFPSPAG